MKMSLLLSVVCCGALLLLSGCAAWRQGDQSTKETTTVKVDKEDGTVTKKTRTVLEKKETSRMQGNGY